jgi:hypothetical protein
MYLLLPGISPLLYLHISSFTLQLQVPTYLILSIKSLRVHLSLYGIYIPRASFFLKPSFI